MFIRKLTPSMSQLLAFEASARLGSFTKAGHELHLTQSAVSRHIQALEQTLQTTLFLRLGRQITLSLEGEIYAHEVRAALMRIRNASMQVYHNSKNEYVLRLAVLPIFGSKWLMPRLAHFYDKHPEIQINIYSRLGELDLTTSDIDAYICMGKSDMENTEYQHLFDAPVVVIANPEELKRKPISQPNDLLQHQLLHVVNHSPSWKESLLESGVDPKQVKLGAQYEYTSHLVQAVSSGLGVGLVAELFVEEEVKQGKIAMVQIDFFHPKAKSYYLAHRQNMSSHPALSCFKQWLCDEMQRE